LIAPELTDRNDPSIAAGAASLRPSSRNARRDVTKEKAARKLAVFDQLAFHRLPNRGIRRRPKARDSEEFFATIVDIHQASVRRLPAAVALAL
jgi:hypothetical protein